MKFAWNIFCATYLIVLLAVGAGGFALVESATSSLMQSQIERVLTSNAYAAKLFFALAEQDAAPQTAKLENQVAQLTETSKTDRLHIFRQNSAQDDALCLRLSSAMQGHALERDGGITLLRAVSRVDLADATYYVETQSDLSGVIQQRDQLIGQYLTGAFLIASLSGMALLCISFSLARPLDRLSVAANRIAAGDYQKRILQKRSLASEEIRRLSADFNAMADAVQQNITQLQEELENREQFVAAFTHELKTPMTSMIGYADLLRSYALDQQERREAADAIYREARRLERLSMQLLDLFVLSHDAPPLASVRSLAFFRALSVSTKFLSEKYGVKIEMHPENAIVLCEPTLLLSLLNNLIDNACKASSAGATVGVFGLRKADGYLVSVRDTGRGIAKEHLSKVTEPFYREDRARARKLGGAGLGLSLCKQIAAMHGATLNFESEVGKGTTVSFTLRCEAPDANGGEGP